MECIRNQGWLSQVWSLQSDFDTEKFAPSRSDGIFFCWANCNSKLKSSLGLRTKNCNWAFLMGYHTVRVDL